MYYILCIMYIMYVNKYIYIYISAIQVEKQKTMPLPYAILN